MKLSSADILKVTHLQSEELEDSSLSFTSVSIDSRNVSPGSIFFALRGERFDGHNFLSNAVKAGAKALIVENKWATMNPSYLKALPVPKLVVDDSARALGELARNCRRKFRIPVLAVGGSNGKTTTKEMIRAVLSEKFNVLATEGNLNNHIGVPLTLLRLEEGHEIAVIEIGTNHPGEIAYLCSLLEPTHGLITNIGREHLEFFGSLQGVAEAEAELFDWLKLHRPRDGAVFLNKDDALLSRRGRGFAKALSYGFARRDFDVQGTDLLVNDQGAAEFDVKTGKSSFHVTLAVPGIHNAKNALAALAVGSFFHVPAGKMQHALASFTAASKRMEVFRVNGITILNDTYNSNPDSVSAALDTLKAMRTTGKKIAVLADMLELGPAAADEHRLVGEHVHLSGVEYLLTYGQLSKNTNDAATVPFKAHYEQKNMLSEYLAELLTRGDVVLIKGSRGMKMEDVVTFLKERISKAA